MQVRTWPVFAETVTYYVTCSHVVWITLMYTLKFMIYDVDVAIVMYLYKSPVSHVRMHMFELTVYKIAMHVAYL